jgi:shikimate dehydrogenase
MISGTTQVFALIGHPVRHSLSPAMYNALFAELAIDAVYVAFDVFPTRAAGLAAALRTLDLRGANLTVPFKGAILGALDHRTRAVEEAQAANVVVQHDGRLTGYNTDGEGFVRAFEGAFGPVKGLSAVILGAGGAGRAVAAGLADRGAAEVTLLNRSPAEEHVTRLSAYFPDTRFATAALAQEVFAALDADIVVNCTSGTDSSRALDLGHLRPTAVVCDINYWLPDPPLLASGRARGLRVQDGLAMLVEQGALSFELFTGVAVEPAHILARLR